MKSHVSNLELDFYFKMSNQNKKFFSDFVGLNNGKDITDEALRSASEDRDDEALASDADISDTEDNVPDIKQATNPNDEDSIAADDN